MNFILIIPIRVVMVSITNLRYIAVLTHYVNFEIGKKKVSFYIFNYIIICTASERTASRKTAVHVSIVFYHDNSDSAIMTLHIDI